LSRLEQNQRVPVRGALRARFVPALGLEHEPDWVERLLALAAEAGHEAPSPAREAGPTAKSHHNLPLQLTSFIGREKEIARSTYV
jgi:hypothetical protein